MTPPIDILALSPLPDTLAPSLAGRYATHIGLDDAPCDRVRALVGGGAMQVDAALLARLPALEIVAIHGVGHDGVDQAALAARGIRLAITAGTLTEDVADLAIGLWLAVERRIVANDRAVRGGGWDVPLARRATGRRIGIFGLGAIGRAIAARAAPFAADLIYTARSAKDVPWRFVADLTTLAAESDVLFLAAAAGRETHHAVDAAVLAALGRQGVLVNVARGALVDQDALIAALAEGRIAGAGLDVFADEPTVPAALHRDDVVLSPHQGSATVAARGAMAAMVVANLDAHFAGDRPPGLID
ncbi:NAD(P)-dependent oxidoreductase [Sphingomonas sp. RIT328]|uniref:NAD(P)-dependent oxidoreductase n=1 Tax=Sphingomonas sp. RIT328 TaxID=1470591 RepID=UPI000451C4CC|nr:NAD(P)-dependent oxidoreductase [Sphingomonas sp. RIT328]EZP52490.1 D-isomer specific 2-hydroxyacid dehydrogenase, catalytic domain protein [Sphingomonas sp. RIT328]